LQKILGVAKNHETYVDELKLWVGALEDRSPQEDRVGACTGDRVVSLEFCASKIQGWSLGKIGFDP